jgi:AcrR family transcriptional regulator
MRPAESTQRVSRRQADKFEGRRTELAEAALKTLAEFGYARTSLREIAQNSDFSHGVLHYYFADKVDLIIQCVRQYKTRCITRYDELVATASTATELRHGFAAAMAATLVADASLHRLWYDLRSQSLFEDSFRADVADIDASLERMIWRVVSRLSELLAKPMSLPSATTYAIFDGLFQQSLLKHLSGDVEASADLGIAIDAVLLRILPDPAVVT